MDPIHLKSEQETIQLGRKFSTSLQGGDIVKITGSLGAGKTTIVRGIVEGLGGNPAQVHSPTFALVHEYETPGLVINHCDFYRLPQGTELEDLGGLELFTPDRIHLLEWPERIGIALPQDRVFTISLSILPDSRTAQITSVRKIID